MKMTPEAIEAAGGPAFPRPSYGPNEPADGMTLRDYFAAKAMAGFITNIDTRRSDLIDVPQMAKSAYFVADAMLAERAK